MNDLILIADLGRLRVLKRRPAGDDPSEKEHLMEDASKGMEGHVASRGDVVTDQSGRFGHRDASSTHGGGSYGEQHNLDSELERKSLQQLADRIAVVVADEGQPAWTLAAPQSILGRLTDALPRECRKQLTNSIGADLTKEPLAKLEERFGLR